jgi:hypothetical protein
MREPDVSRGGYHWAQGHVLVQLLSYFAPGLAVRKQKTVTENQACKDRVDWLDRMNGCSVLGRVDICGL